MSGTGVAERELPTGDRAPKDAGLPVISFVHPIPGFPGLKRFLLVRMDDGTTEQPPEDHAPDQQLAEALIYELRSVDRPEVRFVVCAAHAFFPEYDVELDDQTCDDLELIDAPDAMVLVVLTVGSDAANTTGNLLAPMVINSSTLLASQVILSGTDWPVRAPLG